jgi:hypothetical protein
MIVDQDGMFLTQRAFTKMALMDVALAESGLLISDRFQEGSQVIVPFEPVSRNVLRVTVWDDTVDAMTVSDEVDAWLTEQLDKKVHLVIMPQSTQRKADPRFALNGESVSFADGFPFLLISEASLGDLNDRLAYPIEMKRFRPNFVVSGAEAFGEDTWKSIQIGDIQFDLVKPCARCILTTIDPETGEKGAEPLKTLASYRRVNNKVLFGQNLVAVKEGTVSEGDNIKIL